MVPPFTPVSVKKAGDRSRVDRNEKGQSDRLGRGTIQGGDRLPRSLRLL